MSHIVELQKALGEEGRETRIWVVRALGELEDPRAIARATCPIRQIRAAHGRC